MGNKRDEHDGEAGSVSDGHHTFDELYEHRHRLFIALMALRPERAWASRLHADGTMYDGWFVAGMTLPCGNVSYHLPDRLWAEVERLGFVRDRAPEWDGHTAADTLERLAEWTRMKGGTDG